MSLLNYLLRQGGNAGGSVNLIIEKFLDKVVDRYVTGSSSSMNRLLRRTCVLQNGHGLLKKLGAAGSMGF